MIQTVSNSNVMLNAKAGIAASEKADNNTVDKTKQAEVEKAKENTDKFVKEGDTATAGVYKKPDKFTADELRAINEQRVTSFQNMLINMLGKQATNYKKTTFDDIAIGSSDKLNAQKAIGPGGEWSPEKVAGRILDMAKALSGGDASKFELLKNAAMKGFGEAEKAWGDKLPSITKDTYEQTMKGFDDWKAELDGKTTTAPEVEK